MFTILLLVASISLLSIAPTATSQSFTTITSLATVTTQATYTQATSYPVGTSTATSTMTETIVDETFTMSTIGSSGCMVHEPISFSALKGQIVKGEIAVDIRDILTVYILSDAQYAIWSTKHYCTPEDAGTSALVRAFKVKSCALDWSVKKDGTYWLIIETWGPYTKECTITASVARYYSQAVTSVAYSTQSSLLVLTATRTLTSIQTEQITQAFPSTEGGMLGLVAIGIVAVVVVLFVVLVRRRREPSLPRTGSPPYAPPRPTAAAPQTTKYCISCGSRIPQGARHCARCGASQG